jgi:hypothetical protein
MNTMKLHRIIVFVLFVILPIALIRWVKLESFNDHYEAAIFIFVLAVLICGWYFIIFYENVALLPILLLACGWIFWTNHHLSGLLAMFFSIATFLMKSDFILKQKQWKSITCLGFSLAFFLMALLSAMII